MVKVNKCRTCFNENRKGLHSLTKTISDKNNQQRTFAELLNEVANINIHNDKYSKLPKAICGCCSRKLKDAHAFVQQAQEVNEKLYSMFMHQSDNISIQLDCLQEVQFDLERDIKMESDTVYDQSPDSNMLAETEYLKKDIKFKEEDPEENEITTLVKSDENPEDSKPLKDFLDITCTDISITTEISDNKHNVWKSFQQSDSNSSNKSSSVSASDDDDWQDKSLRANTKSVKKEKKSQKKLTKSNKIEETDDKKNKNDDEDEGWSQIKCNECDKIFANSRLLNQHLNRNHVPDELKIQCLQCEAKFSRRHNMYSHMRRIHKSENIEDLKMEQKKLNVEKRFACQQCPRSYTNKYKLIAHVNSHHNPNITPKKRTLLPKKRFLCTLCGLKFDSTGHLNIHYRSHTGEKPYKCEFCDRAYPRLYDVTVHRRTHTGEKPYHCTLCEKTFRNSNKLTIHMRTHTNERPYKCIECDKAFKQSKDLNIHKRTHTGERPYECAVCHSTFTQSNSLRLHQIKQQHLEKPSVGDNLLEGTTSTNIN